MIYSAASANSPFPLNERLVTAAFVDPDAAERAIGALLDHGIGATQISVATRAAASGMSDGAAVVVVANAQAARNVPIYQDKDGFMEVQTSDPPTPTDMNAATDSRRGGSSSLSAPDSPIAAEGERALTTTTPADAAKGAANGSLVGLGVGILAGAAALTLPGVGLVLAAGPLWAAVGAALGTTAAGAVAGGVTGYLRDMGVPVGVADLHHEALSSGSILVTVHLNDRDASDAVAATLVKYGGAVAA